jgi:hypothetical protein
MREMPRVDASIFRDVGVHWDVSNSSDIVQVMTVAGKKCEGSDGY